MRCAFPRDVPTRRFLAVADLVPCARATFGGEGTVGNRPPGTAYISLSRPPDISLVREHAGSTLGSILTLLSRPRLSRCLERRPFSSVSAGRLRAGCGTLAINLSRHAIIFVSGAGVYRGGEGGRREPPTPTRGYFPHSRVRAHAYLRIRVRVHKRRAADDGTSARDSRARDNDNTAWAPRVYSPSKAQHARCTVMACISRRRYTRFGWRDEVRASARVCTDAQIARIVFGGWRFKKKKASTIFLFV